LYRILSENSIQSPKHKRKKSKKNIHTTRPRKKYFGELLQIDASLHNWFGINFPKATLHGAIDDATGIIMGLYFDFEETLNGYYEMLWKILTKYGIPETFYSDNRTIFEFRKLSEKNKEIDRDVHIQFKRCCSQLGIELITTSVPQAKGRIERLWQTLQSRLQSELVLRNIATVEEANNYLDEFMTSYNNRFAISPDLETSLFVDPPKLEEIDYYLSIQYQRKTDNGSTFKLNGQRYQIVNDFGEIVKIFPKETIDLYVTRSHQIVAVYNGKFYDLVTVEKSLEIINESPNKPKWKPGPNHPWRKYITIY